MEWYQYVHDNCFLKLAFQCSGNNRYLVSSFKVGKTVFDILWISSLERPCLFTNNSLSLCLYAKQMKDAPPCFP